MSTVALAASGKGQVALAVIGLLALCVGVIAALLWGVSRRKPSTEMTDADVKRYREAARILNRLINETHLSGDFGLDILSQETRKEISAWIADYKKGLRSK